MTRPTMKAINIIEALPDTPGNSFDFTADYTHTVGDQSVTENYTIFNTAYFIQELLQHYDEHLVKLPVDDPQSALVALFNIWKASRADAYARRMYALSTKYEPLDNYDRTETKESEGKTTYGRSETLTHGLTIEDTFNNYHEETERTGSVTTADGIYGVNSSTAVPSDTSTQTYNKLTDDRSITGSKETEHSGSDTTAHTGHDDTEDSYTLRAHGNIGVTTSAQMLSEDFKLLSLDLAQTAVAEFIDRYTYYIGGLSL